MSACRGAVPRKSAGEGGGGSAQRGVAAAQQFWAALPADVLAKIVGHLAGDVPSLCAVSCLGRAWRNAAAEPRLWARPAQLPAAAAERLTDAHLIALVARARGCMERLDVRGAPDITDDGLCEALQRLPLNPLVAFFADQDCDNLTADGVAVALHERRGSLLELCVEGLRCGPGDSYSEGSDTAERQADACYVVLNDEVLPLMAPGSDLDGTDFCWQERRQRRRKRCNVLCGRTSSCPHCGLALCFLHQLDSDRAFLTCPECGVTTCDSPVCRRGPREGPLCQDCYEQRL